MKNVLCYFGIIILLGLILMPPILRIVRPKEEQKAEELIKKNRILACSNELFVINTSYEGDDVYMVVIKKLFSKEEMKTRQNASEEETTSSKKSTSNSTKSLAIEGMFMKLKENQNVTDTVLDDGEVLSVDFSLASSNNNLGIDNINLKIEEQQLYYEKQNLSCLIK